MYILKLKKIFIPCILLIFCLFLGSCFNKKTQEKNLLINGAGASFPYILYSKWLSEYRSVNPSVFINYQSIGSGGGIRQFIKGTLDFGGTDVPVSKKDILAYKKEILHIPTTLGAVALTYNLDLQKKINLRLDAGILSKIFRGKITNWNDPQIQNLNKGLNLPNLDIVVIYRADGSGTTNYFTDYLSQLSPEFLKEVGKGKSVPWPVGVGGKGNEGIMGLVSKLKGSIAYMGVSYAVLQKLPTIAIKNKSGQFIKPTIKSIKEAGIKAIEKNKEYTSSLVNIEGKKAYPLSGFTYIIISKQMPKHRGQALVNFLKWALGEGQKFSEPLHFTPLPEKVRKIALKKLSEVTLK